jgi:predicted alpha/beta hydrolase family esterase
MRTAIIIHGTPSKEEFYDPYVPSSSNHHWLPWLQKHLILHGYAAHTPEMPNAWAPDYAVWEKEFERYEIDEHTALIGHSCGAGFLVRWLSEHKRVRVDKVILVAPWLDPDKRKAPHFFEFKIDPKLRSRANSLSIFHSSNDYSEVQESVKMLRKAVPGIPYREFQNYGHFCLHDLHSPAFPELLESLVVDDFVI